MDFFNTCLTKKIKIYKIIKDSYEFYVHRNNTFSNWDYNYSLNQNNKPMVILELSVIKWSGSNNGTIRIILEFHKC